MITNDEARARVQRGAAHLDQVRPGWFNRIDVGTLTLHDNCGCIIGQLCGGTYNPAALGLRPDDGAFNLHTHPNYIMGRGKECYRELQDAWIEAIADRRLSTAPNGTPHSDAVPVRPTADMTVCSR